MQALTTFARFLLLGLLGLIGGLLLGACSREAPYQLRQGRWTFEDRPIEGADKASFQPLNASFARDRNSGYYRGIAIADSEGASFQALSDNDARDQRHVWRATTFRKAQEYWSVKHQRVWIIEGADASSYRVLDEDYTADARRVYYGGAPFEVHDAASFAVLGGGYARDRVRGYYERREIPGSDGSRFQLLDPHDLDHAHDGQRVFHAHFSINDPQRPKHHLVRVLPGARPASTQSLGRGYARDGERFFHRGLLLKGVDAASFEVVHGSTPGCPIDTDAIDSRGCWADGQRVPGLAASAPAGPR